MPRHLCVRQQQLIQRAKKGKLTPLVAFLQGLSVGEDVIWLHIGALFYTPDSSEVTQKYVEERISHNEKVEDDLTTRVLDFEENVRLKNYFPIVVISDSIIMTCIPAKRPAMMSSPDDSF